MKSSFTPVYTIDVESVARQSLNSQLNTVLLLVSKTADPKFDRARLCYGCEFWSSAGKSQSLPRRPGAWNAAYNCVGCAYGHLDEARYRTAEEREALTDAAEDAGEATDLDFGDETEPTLAAQAKRRYKREQIRLADQNARWCACPTCGGRGTVEDVLTASDKGEQWKRIHRCRNRQAEPCKTNVEILPGPPTDYRPRPRVGELRPEQIRWTRAGVHQIDDQAGLVRRINQRYTTARLEPGEFRRAYLEHDGDYAAISRALEPKPIEE